MKSRHDSGKCFLFSFFLLFFILGSNSLVSFADGQGSPLPKVNEPKLNELDATLAHYRIQNGYGATSSIATRGNGLTYGRILSAWLEISTKVALESYANTDQVAGATKLNVTLGPTFNFAADPSGVPDAVFITLGVGINYSAINSLDVVDTYYTTPPITAGSFAYNIEVGKRFALLPGLSWKPSVTVSGYTGIDIFNSGLVSYPALRIIPVRFAAIF